MSRVDNIMSAFLDEDFQSMLQNKRIEIEKILIEFIKKISDKKVSKKIISRIKSEDSLREKLERNDYINQWQIKDSNKEDIKQKICENLPDLIGFRINCYFKKDEEVIYEKLLTFFKKKNCIKIEESPNSYQKNGFKIFKIACRYKELNNNFSFEVQVKSFLNDVWGEVEHRTVYKSKIYDSREELKKDIFKGLYHILDGSDRQLNKLYSFNVGMKEIKQELFFHYASSELQNSKIILSEDYINFFELINIYIKGSEGRMDQYIGSKLLNEPYKKEEISIVSCEQIENYKSKIDFFKLKKFSQLMNLLYEFKSEDILLAHLIKQVRDIAVNPDDFMDQEEQEDIENNIFEETIKGLSYLIKNNIAKEE